MDPSYRGHGEYGSEEQEEHHRPHFHQRPPPPPPCPDEEDGEGRYGERRYGERRDEEDGERRYGERRDEEDEEYPPEPPPRFPPTGQDIHHRPEFPHHHKTPDAYAPSDPYTHYDAPTYTHHDAPPCAHANADPYNTQPPSDSYTSHHKEPAARPHASSFGGPAESAALELPQGRLVRVFCKENSSFNLAVEHNSVVMVQANTEDEAQQWIKDASYGMRIKDSYGYPAFSLVNKKTRKVLKHAKEKGQQVLLMDYQSDIKDDDILWSESQDFGEGFKTVRSASDTLLNLTVFEGNKKIRNGSALVLDTWHKGDHQLWKLFPLCKCYLSLRRGST